jgi:hypothetical protein
MEDSQVFFCREAGAPPAVETRTSYQCQAAPAAKPNGSVSRREQSPRLARVMRSPRATSCGQKPGFESIEERARRLGEPDVPPSGGGPMRRVIAGRNGRTWVMQMI